MKESHTFDDKERGRRKASSSAWDPFDWREENTVLQSLVGKGDFRALFRGRFRNRKSSDSLRLSFRLTKASEGKDGLELPLLFVPEKEKENKMTRHTVVQL